MHIRLDIVGAFLAGLAVNGAVEDKPSKEKLGFIGKALFIPSFFIVTGLLIDPVTFAESIGDHFALVCGIVAALVLAKGIAAACIGRAYGYPLGADKGRYRVISCMVKALPE